MHALIEYYTVIQLAPSSLPPQPLSLILRLFRFHLILVSSCSFSLPTLFSSNFVSFNRSDRFPTIWFRRFFYFIVFCACNRFFVFSILLCLNIDIGVKRVLLSIDMNFHPVLLEYLRVLLYDEILHSS